MKHETLTFRFLDMSRGGFARLFLLLLLPCLSVIGVKAADSDGGVKFNSAVRYSQWAINSRLYDFKESTNNCGFDLYDKDGKLTKAAQKWKKYDTGLTKRFHYVPGLVAKAILESADFYKGFDWSKPWFYSAQAYAQEVTYNNNTSAPTLDAMNAVKMYFPILSSSLKSSNVTTKANTAISKLATDLKNYNDKFAIGGDNSSLKEANPNDTQKGMLGGWFHKSTDYVDQMWLDGAYMGSATLAQLAEYYNGKNNIFGSTSADWNMVTKQLNIVWNNCWDSNKQLMYHAFSATGDAKAKSGSSETWAGLSTTTPVYHSAAFWGRANAWYLFALVDALEAMQKCSQTNTENYNTLKQHLEAQAKGILRWQDQQTGGWYQIMDEDNTYKANSYSGETWTTSPYNNYIETSASTIFAAALFKAVRLGLLGDSYKAAAKKAFEGIVENFVVQDSNNETINIWSSSLSAGLGGNSFRDGSNDYYILGKDTKRVLKEDNYTEGKVLGGFIMAATEYERAYQNQDSKQILFAKDLAPSYDFTTTERELDATAYGNGTVSYQWYKDGSAIADATSATYAPTENGSYYCIATAATNSRSAGNNTIQTSTTTVTTANTDNGSTDNNGGSDNGTTTGNIFSYTIKTTENADNTPYKAEGGTVTLGAAKVDVNGFKSDGNLGSSKYILVSLNNNTLQEGDVIKISAYSTSTGKGGLVACKDKTTCASSVSLGNMTKQNEDISYTVTASDILNGLSTFYIYRKTDESTYVKSISITRANTQVALTASFSPATISATVGDVAKDLPALTVEAGETTLTANDYTVTYASDKDAVAKVENGKVSFVGEGETNIVTTIKPTETNKYKETSATFAVKVEKKQTPVTPTEGEVIYNWNTIGSQKENIAVTEGTKNINGTSVPCINFGSNYNASRYTYMSIKDKDNGGFKAGDIITITGLYTGNKTTGIGMEIHTTRDGKAVFSTPYYNKELQTYTYTLTEDCDSLFFGRYGGATPNVTELKVVRPAASTKQRLSANFDTNNIKVVKGTQSITLPNLTVKAGSTELTATSDYSVSYESDANEIAILNGTQVNFVSGKTGLVTITAKVTPTNATKYEGTEAYYQILIQDPTPLNISVTDIDMNATDAEIKEPVVKVYGENDQLLKLGTDYILSYKSNGGPVSFPDGKLTVAGSSYNWTEGTSTITVTATPTANMENAYKAGSVDFVYAVSKGLITPKFLDTFNNIIVKLATKTGSKDNTNTFTVPLIFNGEDVSSYFDYTYTISPSTNTQSVSGNVLTYTPKTAGTYTVTVSAKPKTNDIDPSQDYTDVYNVPANISFTLDVKDDYIRPVVKVNPVSIDMYTGTRVSSPDVTVTNYNGGAVIDETSYTISWTTFTPSICKVDDNGNIEAVSEGDGKIRVTIKGDKMESTTAFLKVLVDDPAMYRVKSNGETYGNQATMWNQDKTLSVTLGGWMFPNDGIPDTKILDQNKKDPEKLSNSYQWGTASSKAKWKLTGFDYYVSGNNSKNARQENGSNAMPETTTIGSADFKTYTTEVKDPMFNVPCSGSFLVFNPKTNGKVTAHIFQNGAFDTSGGKTSYRPQRRVFVMNEAGNFVTSTAHIESTNGKPTGGVYDLTKYSWDLNGGKAPTAAEVANHFDGLESFVMTQDGFKNNVYPSALSADIMPNNNAITNHPGDKSAQGWCVLADSPVTYTFNVKAGKTYYLYNFGSKIGFYGFSFDEDETKPVEDVVSYDDNTTNTIKTTEAGHVAKVTVNRKMTAGIWTTCVLPFSLNVHQVDAIFGDTYKSGNENGTQILYFDRVEGNKVYFVRHAYNTIVAGKPFLIKPTKDVTSINTAEVTDYPYVTIENTEPANWCSDNYYTWASSYSYGMTVKEGDGFISKDGLFKNFVGESGTLKGFRGYLKRLGTQTGAKPIMLQVVNSSNVDGDNGETTGIEDLIIDADGQLMPANGKVYNINGQLVSEDANSFQSLPSGIYIINGKKYIK